MRSIVPCCVLIPLISVFCIGQSQLASSVLPVEEMLSQPSIPYSGGVALSPDGLWLAYTVERPKTSSDQTGSFWSATGVPETVEGSVIRLVNTKSRKWQDITSATSTSWGPSWSPDGRSLAFYSDHDGKAQLWLFDRITGTTKRLSEVESRSFGQSQPPRWSPDSNHILIKTLSGDEPTSFLRVGGSKQIPLSVDSRTNKSASVVVYQSASGANDSHSLTHDSFVQLQESNLALIDVANGRAQTIAQHVRPVWYSIAPTGGLVAFANLKGLANGEPYEERLDLVVVESTSKASTTIASDIRGNSHDFRASWSPDAKLIAFITSGKENTGDVFLAATDGSEARVAAAGTHPAFGPFGQPPLWANDGNRVFVVATDFSLWDISLPDKVAREVARLPNRKIYTIAQSEDGRGQNNDDGSIVVSTIHSLNLQAGFFRISQSGKWANLVEGEKSYNPYQVLLSRDARTMAFLQQGSAQPPNLMATDESFSNTTQLSDIGSELDSQRMGGSRLVHWRSADGQELRGALLLPAGYQPGKRYPLIVEIYPSSMSGCLNQFGLCGDTYIPNKQLFASRGYAVLFPDAPIKSGTFVSDLMKTVLPGVDKVVELGIADNDRIGLIGQSWGGYATLALITATSRFRAAVMLAGNGDLTALYGEMDKFGSSLGVSVLEGDVGRHMPGPPWQYPQLYLENSPIYHLDRVETPLLIIHGAEDANVAPFLGDQIFVGLRRLNRDVVYAKYAGEGHVISSFANQLDCTNRILEWFAKHLVAN